MSAVPQTEADAQPAASEQKGWGAIQQNIRLHDEGMIKDFSEDIDALLVFAGLFSAALTAFLGPVIARLQMDNSQLSAQLLSILVLRGGSDPEFVPFLSSTASSLPRSTVFRPPATSVAINTLWFLSLVLSLSAALFGILAKQWCREYLKWYSVLAPARENIMLRQMRYEAWQEWHVTSQITAIPALLELSLILFFVGLVIYSWTLQVTLFSFVVGAVCTVLIVTLASTLLPTFYRRSPYKSATGWAFNRLAHVLTRQIPSLDKHKFPIIPEHLRDWRVWDFRFALDANLCELAGLLGPKATYEHEEADATVDAFQTSLLVRALAWVRRGSIDDKLSEYIDDCLATIYDMMRTGEGSSLHIHTFVYPMRLAMKYTEYSHSVGMALLSQLDTRIDEPHHRHGALRLRSTPFGRWVAHAGPYIVSMEMSSPTDDTLLTLARKAMALRLRGYIATWVYAQGDPTADNLAKDFWAEKIAQTLCFLRYVPRDYLNNAIMSNGLYSDFLAGHLLEAYRELARHEAAFCNGLVPIILELLRSLGEVHVSIDLGECYVTPWNSIPWLSEQNCHLEKFRGFMSQVAPESDSGSDDVLRERCHLLVTAANDAIDLVGCQVVEWRGAEMLPPLHVLTRHSEEGTSDISEWFTSAQYQATSVRDILKMMTGTVTGACRRGLRNCGAFIELPWLRSLVRVYEHAYAAGKTAVDVHFTMDPYMQGLFVELLAALCECGENDLLDGTEVWKDFVALTTLLKRPGMTPAVRKSLDRVDTQVRNFEQRSWEQLVAPKISLVPLLSRAVQRAQSSTVDRIRHTDSDRVQLLEHLSQLADSFAQDPFSNTSVCEDIFSIVTELWRRHKEIVLPEFRIAVCNLEVKLLSTAVPVPSSTEERPQPSSAPPLSSGLAPHQSPSAPEVDGPWLPAISPVRHLKRAYPPVPLSLSPTQHPSPLLPTTNVGNDPKIVRVSLKAGRANTTASSAFPPLAPFYSLPFTPSVPGPSQAPLFSAAPSAANKPDGHGSQGSRPRSMVSYDLSSLRDAALSDARFGEDGEESTSQLGLQQSDSDNWDKLIKANEVKEADERLWESMILSQVNTFSMNELKERVQGLRGFYDGGGSNDRHVSSLIDNLSRAELLEQVSNLLQSYSDVSTLNLRKLRDLLVRIREWGAYGARFPEFKSLLHDMLDILAPMIASPHPQGQISSPRFESSAVNASHRVGDEHEPQGEQSTECVAGKEAIRSPSQAMPDHPSRWARLTSALAQDPCSRHEEAQ